MGVKVSNNAFGTLSAAINTTATTITLDSGQGARFPTLGASDYFFGTLVDTSNNLEVVKVTARSTDSLTVVRGQDGTSAASFAIGDRFELRPTAALFEAIQDEASVDGITSNSTSGTALTVTSDNDLDVENNLVQNGTLPSDLATTLAFSQFGTGAFIQSSASDNQAFIKSNHYWGTGGHTKVTSGHGQTTIRLNENNDGILQFETCDNAAVSPSARLKINEDGYITTPAQPSFTAHRNVDQAVNISSSEVTLVFDVAEHNIGSHYSTSTGRFTCPVSGVYFIAFSIRLDYLSGSYAWIHTHVNGVRQSDNGSPNFITQATGNYTSLAAAGQLELSANDYVELKAYVAADTSWDFENASYFSMRLMG